MSRPYVAIRRLHPKRYIVDRFRAVLVDGDDVYALAYGDWPVVRRAATEMSKRLGLPVKRRSKKQKRTTTMRRQQDQQDDHARASLG